MTPAEFYLSYVNEFLTVNRFAEYYGLSRASALTLIDKGKQEHESAVAKAKVGEQVAALEASRAELVATVDSQLQDLTAEIERIRNTLAKLSK